MKKTILLMSLATTLFFANVTTSFAEDTSDINYITINGVEHKSYLSTDDTPYGDPAADPIPQNDQAIVRSTKAAVVTDSSVQRYQFSGDDPDYAYNYYAKGYVTMKNGTSDAYHYSRAEIWYNGSVAAIGSNKYGYGKVYAESYPTPKKGTARIFYGE